MQANNQVQTKTIPQLVTQNPTPQKTTEKNNSKKKFITRTIINMK